MELDSMRSDETVYLCRKKRRRIKKCNQISMDLNFMIHTNLFAQESPFVSSHSNNLL